MMRRILLIFLIILLSFQLNSQNVNSVSQTDLLITHPTVSNLKTVIGLIDMGLINIPELEITGICYKKERYDFLKSEDFLSNYKGKVKINLIHVDGELSPSTIYNENSLSSIFKSAFQNSKGIFFFGGDDLPPVTYNEKMNLHTDVYDTYRHLFELSFLFHLLGGNQDTSFIPLLTENPDYIIRVFCLGLQTMNVATGGSLIQDIPSELYDLKYVDEVIEMDINSSHKNYYMVLHPEKIMTGGRLHAIKVLEETTLYNMINDDNNTFVYSYHHQCIKDLGQNLKPIAFSTDGKIIEAVQHEKFPNVLGVQFHPEKNGLYDTSIKYVHLPQDTVPKSYFDMLHVNNSYQFHVNIWDEFSKTFTNLDN